MRAPRRPSYAIWWSTGIAALLEIGGLMLLGVPGAIYAFAAEPVVAPLRGLPAGALLAGDRAWPIAIVMTIAVPPAIPVVHWLARRLTAWPLWQQVPAMIGGAYLWAVAVLFALSFA